MLLRGLGLTADEPKAVGYLRSAAEKGIAGAQNRLAHVYLEGIGVDRSAVEAAKWRLLAKASGLEDAVLDKALASLSKADRATAERAASEWRERAELQLPQ
jgi:TPR repeat protein